MNIARRFLLGRYIPGKSILHRIDGRVKIMIMVIISLSIFLTPDSLHLLVPFAAFVFLLPFSGLKLTGILKGIIPILWLAAFSAAAHILIPPSNPEIAVLISGRIIILFLWATVLTTTTSAPSLAASAAWFMRPLKFTGISPEKTALTLSISLRFFPMVLEEAENIIKAQKIRAEKYPLKKRLESFSVAFILRLLKKARSIDDAVKNRRLLEEGHFAAAGLPSFGFADYAAILAGLLIFSATVNLL